MKPKKIIIDDLMQKGHYYLTEPIGKNFDVEFKPELSPIEMLELGVFGGKYMTDCTKEFPSSWYKNAKLSPEAKDISINFFEVDASLSLKEWQRKGWIHPIDPRGWFQWYCRYYYGRRLDEEDKRQIKRWKGITRRYRSYKEKLSSWDAELQKKTKASCIALGI